MFDTIAGIPLHPLIVHGVVVLLPLTILGTIALAVRPAWRAKYGYLLIGIAVVATGLVQAAAQSGEKFEKHLGDAGRHGELGEQLIWFTLPLLVLAIALVVMDRRATANPGRGGVHGAGAVKVVAALAVLAAIAAGYQVYRVGDSGARAAWCGAGNPQYTCKIVQ